MKTETTKTENGTIYRSHFNSESEAEKFWNKVGSTFNGRQVVRNELVYGKRGQGFIVETEVVD